MSVAKYAARFELGLTTTTPTVTFARNEVLRTPDLNSASLMISEAAMRAVCDEFWRKRPGQAGELLPGLYLPSEPASSFAPDPGRHLFTRSPRTRRLHPRHGPAAPWRPLRRHGLASRLLDTLSVPTPRPLYRQHWHLLLFVRVRSLHPAAPLPLRAVRALSACPALLTRRQGRDEDAGRRA